MNTNLIEGLSNLKPTDLDAGQVFSGKPSGTTVKGYAVPSAYTPAIDHDYIFHEGITALIKAGAQAIDTVRYGANHFNVKLTPAALAGPAGERLLVSLIKTYCDFDGSHIQFNCVSSETLKDAQTKPADYRNLVVRVAGFSAYFTRLDKGVQNEIVKRTEYNNF